MTTMGFGFNTSSDFYPHLGVIAHLLHPVSSNDEAGADAGVAPATNETGLSPSSTPSLAQRRAGPAIARAEC